MSLPKRLQKLISKIPGYLDEAALSTRALFRLRVAHEPIEGITDMRVQILQTSITIVNEDYRRNVENLHLHGYISDEKREQRLYKLERVRERTLKSLQDRIAKLESK